MRAILWLSRTSLLSCIGGKVAATDKLGVYGEFSFANIADEEIDNTYGTKLGVKYSF